MRNLCELEFSNRIYKEKGISKSLMMKKKKKGNLFKFIFILYSFPFSILMIDITYFNTGKNYTLLFRNS